MIAQAVDPVREFLVGLDGVKPAGDGYSARCPAHDDRNASLSIRPGADGRALIFCHAGCTLDTILAARGKTKADLFIREDRGGNGTRKPDPIIARYEYRNSDNEVIARKCRTQNKSFFWQHPEGSSGWVNGRNGVIIPLYNLPAILNAREDGYDDFILLVEGEKDADRAKVDGFIATTSPDGASKDSQRPKWRPDFNDQLAGLRVAIICDNDDAGRAHGENAARELNGNAKEIRLISALPGVPEHGDLSDYFDAGSTAESLRKLIVNKPAWTPANNQEPEFTPIPLRELARTYPELRPVVIDGLLRRGQVGNLVSTSKAYKTFMVLMLAVAMAMKVFWLDMFPTCGGRVLIVDLELQRPDIVKRMAAIMEAMHAPPDILDRIDILSFRGRDGSIDNVEKMLLAMTPGTYSLIILDPLYKCYPPQFDENSNAQMTALYRRFERMAEHMDCAILIVHHASKGAQNEKRVVDVGAGAGSQSRSADCHIALRELDPEGIAFDAKVRSFRPPEPLALRFEYPLWRRALDLDPTSLKTGKSARNADKAQPAPTEKPEPWTVDKFVTTFIGKMPKTKATIEVEAEAMDISQRKTDSLLNAAVDAGKVYEWTASHKRKRSYSTDPQPLIEGATV